MAKAVCICKCFHNMKIFEVGDSYELALNEKLDNPNFVVEKAADKKKTEPEPKKASGK